MPMINTSTALTLLRCAGLVRGEDIVGRYHELMINQRRSVREIEDIRLLKLKRLLRHALAHSPYYHEKYKGMGEVRSFEDFAGLDLMTKDLLKAHALRIKSLKPVGTVRKVKTSGSTGMPLAFYKDGAALSYHYAAMYRGHSWYGLQIGDREARLWGVPVAPFLRARTRIKDFLLNRYREHECNLTPGVITDFIDKTGKRRPAYIMGYSRMLHEFASYAQSHGIDLAGLGLRMVKYTSESLEEQDKEYMKEVFQCPVVSEYGCAEAGIIAFECPDGSNHIMSDCVHVEYLDCDRGLAGVKEVVVTDLHNLSFPIMRYRLGDLVVPEDRPCRCGLPFPVMGRVYGRTSGIFRLEGKAYHNAVFNYIIKAAQKKYNRIDQFRVVQTAPDCFTYQLAVNGPCEEVERYIAAKTLDKLGPGVEVSFERFASLPRDESGKLRYFVPYEGPGQ